MNFKEQIRSIRYLKYFTEIQLKKVGILITIKTFYLFIIIII